MSDGEHANTFKSYGFSADYDNKCVAIAQTAAMKAFLKRLAMIFGEYDDPEMEPETIIDKRPDLQRKIDEQTKISGRDIRAFYSAAKKGKRNLIEIKAYLESEFMIDDPSQIEQKHFKQAMEWAFNESISEPKEE